MMFQSLDSNDPSGIKSAASILSRQLYVRMRHSGKREWIPEHSLHLKHTPSVKRQVPWRFSTSSCHPSFKIFFSKRSQSTLKVQMVRLKDSSNPSPSKLCHECATWAIESAAAWQVLERKIWRNWTHNIFPLLVKPVLKSPFLVG